MLLLQEHREPIACGLLMSEHRTWSDKVIGACCRSSVTKECEPLTDPSSCRRLFSFDHDCKRMELWNKEWKRNEGRSELKRIGMNVKKMCLSMDQAAKGIKEPFWTENPCETLENDADPADDLRESAAFFSVPALQLPKLPKLPVKLPSPGALMAGAGMKMAIPLAKKVVARLSIKESTKKWVALLLNEYERTKSFKAVSEKFLFTFRAWVKCIRSPTSD